MRKHNLQENKGKNIKFGNYKYDYNISVWYKLINNEVKVEKIVRDFIYRLLINLTAFCYRRYNTLGFFIDMSNFLTIYVRKKYR